MTEATEVKVAVDVKETLEFLNGIELVSVVGAKIVSDSKVNASDLAYLVDLIKGFDTLKIAVDGIKNIPAEIKDIDSAEAIMITSKVFEIVKAIKAAKG